MSFHNLVQGHVAAFSGYEQLSSKGVCGVSISIFIFAMNHHLDSIIVTSHLQIFGDK